MNAKLAAAVIAIAVLPIAAIAWLGVRSAEHEQKLMGHRFDALIQDRLSDIDGTIRKVVDGRKTELKKSLSGVERDTESLREAARNTPYVNQTFALDAEGTLVHPPDNSRNQDEERFMERTRMLFESKERFYYPGEGTAAPDHGWHSWYWGGGLNLLFWQRTEDGGIVGAEVTRMALVAEIIGELPASDPVEAGMKEARIVLESGSGYPVYSFGVFSPEEDAAPRVTLPLSPPLGAWRLKYYDAPGSLAAVEGTTSTVVWFSLGGLVIAVVALALFVLSEHGRDRREALKRVTFVNQVSHELKTPLTSIRMYAELLLEEIEDDETRAPKYLGVIVSESQRLSRLIGNVLTFSRGQRLRASVCGMDEEIGRVIDLHRPAFEDQEMSIRFKGDAAATVEVDTDMLDQILGNLFSNVEKYAAKKGTAVEVRSRLDGDETEITVEDDGPGIPRGLQEKIFEPFYRISNDVTDGVSGTGIGLAISRDLARLHGGDLHLEERSNGAKFVLVLKTPKPQGETK